MEGENKHIIWSNMNLNPDDWKDDILYEHPDATDDEVCRIMTDTNAEYLEDERLNLNIQLSNPIIIIANLDLWNGRRPGYKIIESGKISDCLCACGDYAEWYVDEQGDLRCSDAHHDGTNQYLYREINPDVDADELDEFYDEIYKGNADVKKINKYTRRLGDYIGDVYGWSFQPAELVEV